MFRLCRNQIGVILPLAHKISRKFVMSSGSVLLRVLCAYELPGSLVKMQVVMQVVGGVAWESAYLASSHIVLMPPA